MKINSLLVGVGIGCFAASALAGGEYYYTPKPAGGISGKTFVGAAGPENQMHFNISGVPLSAADAVITSWNLGAFTGATVPAPLSSYQRGYKTSSFGGHSFSMHDELSGGNLEPVFGVMMNSWDLPMDPNSPLAGTYLAYSFPNGGVAPFAHGVTSTLYFGQLLQIPQAYATSDPGRPGAAYMSQGFTFGDPVSGRFLWFMPSLFDTRPNLWTEGIMLDEGTRIPMVQSFIGPSTQFVTQSGGSYGSTSQTWIGWRWFGYSVSYAQMSAAIAATNAFLATHCDQPPGSTNYPLLKSSNVLVPPGFGVTGYNECTPYPTNIESLKVGTFFVSGEITLPTTPGSLVGANLGFSTKGHWFYSLY